MLLSVLLWLVALEALGLAALPLAHRVFASLPDRGYAAAKMLGLVLVSYVAWLTGILGITGFTGPTLVVITLILGGVSWWCWGSAVRASWGEARPLVIAAEVCFLVVFVLAVWVRAYNSAIAGQEKQMDMTFLHSLIQTDSLPAEDLWLAGYSMPYYYLGYLTHAVVAKVTTVDPPVAYNLAVASVLALAAVGAFGLAGGLIRLAGGPFPLAAGGGAFGAFALTIMGNLEALFEVVAAQGMGDRAFWSAIGIKGLEAHARGFPPTDGVWWFHAARVIPNIQPDGITEFPYFSFILGDLHPHYMAIPLGVLIATLAAQAIAGRAPLMRNPDPLASAASLGAARSGGSRFSDLPRFPAPAAAPQVAGISIAPAPAEGPPHLPPAPPPARGVEPGAGAEPVPARPAERRASGPRGDWIAIGVTAIVLGAVIPFNTWDIPVFWGLFGLSYLLVALAERPRTPPGDTRATGVAVRGALGGRVRDLAALAGIAAALYSPYAIGYTSQPLGLALTAERTFFGSLFVLFGPLILLPLLGGLVAAAAASADGTSRGAVSVQAGGILAGGALVALREPTLGFLVAAIGLWAPLTWVRAWSGSSARGLVTAVVTTVGLGSILVPEVVYLSDSFQSRMNTVFKFYYDAWILLALAAPLLTWELLVTVRAGGAAWLRGVAATTIVVALVLSASGAIYPIFATHTKSGGFAGPPTLDGMSYLRVARPDDVAAIEWLRKNHPGAVVVEAVGNDYTDAGRVSTFAGTPTLIGWVGHQLQWRGGIPELDRRQQLARRIYTDPASVDWTDLAQRLRVQFVVVGSMEREIYGPDVLSRVEQVLSSVYRSGSTVVFSVRADADGASRA